MIGVFNLKNSLTFTLLTILAISMLSGCSDSKAFFKENINNDLVTLDNKDIWTYYNNAKWSDNYNGLKMNIEKVFVTDTGDHSASDPNSSYIGLKFRMENTANETFSAYPDDAKIITSNGEEIDEPDLSITSDLGGEIEKGATKEGNVVWELKKDSSKEIKWIKMEWEVHKGDEDNVNEAVKTYSVTIDLKRD
jgi:hypothetical protein